MRHANRSVHFWMLGAFVGVVLAFSTPVHAQYTLGQPVIATGPSGTTSDGSYWDAKIFVGMPVNDLCGKIRAAWNIAGVTGATIDARGITGAQTCASSPFPTGANGRLLLGNTVITTSVTWQIPSRVHVEGLGVAGLASSTTANTTIKAGSGLTGAVVQLGGIGGVLSFDAQVKSLTVDAAGIASIGILNNSSQEGSTVEDVNIYNATQVGLSIGEASSSLSANNSGPYRNINIQYNTTCSGSCGSSTTGISVVAATLHSSGIRGIDNVTVSASPQAGGPSTLGNCIFVVGFPVQITNSHLEYCTTGIQTGAGSPATNNVEVQNVSVCCSSGWGVAITNAGDILLSGISVNNTSVAPQVLNDSVTLNQIVGTAGSIYYLGYYLLGDNIFPFTPGVISTTAMNSGGSNLKWVAPGDLHVDGTLSKFAGSFKIDDPLDPANKYLYHSFVESPDMMNVYNGSVTTDKHGTAVVTLPDYFDALNRDFRYQLTAIGTFAQATVAKKIQDNRFAIRTSKPGVEVSWQVTGIRQDAYANAHRIQVEEQKPPREQGHYLHPEVFDTKGKQVVAEQAVGK
jgi:hypothetical protein